MRQYFRGRLFVVLILAVCFLLGFLLNLVIDGGRMPHRELVGLLLSPVRTGISGIRDGITHISDTFAEYDTLKEENEELRRQVADLRRQVSESAYDRDQNERYRKMLSVSEQAYSFEYVSAQVVSVPSDGWNYTFGINAGTKAGLEKGQVVVSEDGLVGKITDVGLNWATVSCFIDPQISVGATILSSGEVGITEGSLPLKAEGRCALRYLSRDADVNRGDAVYSSGLGGIYPKGILLGSVAELSYEDDGLTMTAILEPAVDFSDLKDVLVITNFSEDEK